MVNCAAQGTHTFKLLSTRVYVFIMIFTPPSPPSYSKAINLNTSGWIPSSGIFTGKITEQKSYIKLSLHFPKFDDDKALQQCSLEKVFVILRFSLENINSQDKY